LHEELKKEEKGQVTGNNNTLRSTFSRDGLYEFLILVLAASQQSGFCG
jgi:hypothetical protein